MPRCVETEGICCGIRLCADLTLIAVAHRISTLKGTDRIVILD
jgi:ABC-type multidrug transport system fused ATPase/permease subunit